MQASQILDTLWKECKLNKQEEWLRGLSPRQFTYSDFKRINAFERLSSLKESVDEEVMMILSDILQRDL